ncbi:unnamed protein product [Acanthoscelides obtectus]|nr:unnamed protein product [Acanthoscelides obtectus]CAK1668785.1 Glucose dehydrogenase [FAD, quinone] [Acanthoscelides obtectus]
MLNNLIYIRGHASDYNEWFQDKEGYDYTKDILPYFEKLEISSGNTAGSIFVDDLPYITELPGVLLKAVKELGSKGANNIRTVKQGFGIPKVNVIDGKRWTSASHFIYSKPSNVLLRTDAMVDSIQFHDNFEAYGVEFLYSGNKYSAKASRGIIISAGVINTPKILMMSGVGPKKHLKELGIVPRIDLPVGENLQDHITTGFDLVLLNKTLDIGIGTMLSPSSPLNYFREGRGPWTTIGCELVGFIEASRKIPYENSSNRPDLQLMIMPLGIVEDTGFHLRKLMGISDYSWNRYFAALYNESTVTFLPVLLHPKSRGYIRLRDKNIDSNPVINPRYLSRKEDVDLLVKGVRYIQRLIATKTMHKFGARFNSIIFPGCESHEFDTDSYWECYVRHMTITSYHPVGTCKMGHEKDSSTVLNYNFEVKGTNKLFVVDGSVLPTLPSSNPYASIMMLAEMASDIIKAKYVFSYSTCDFMEVFIKKNVC